MIERACRGRGRPRSFDREAALDVALKLFWERGYEAVSVADLTGAMGIHAPSFYAAFGSKERLFAEAVERYAAAYAGAETEALEAAPTAREAVARLLRVAVERFTAADCPSGCMIVSAALACSAENEAVATVLAEMRRRHIAAIERRLARGVAEGDLPQGLDVAALAASVAAVAHGLSIQARDGAKRDELRRVADAFLGIFPGR